MKPTKKYKIPEFFQTQPIELIYKKKRPLKWISKGDYLIDTQQQELVEYLDSLPLTAMQRRFLLEYMVDLDAYRATRAAGYSERSATACVQRLLGSQCLSQAIEKIKQIRARDCIIDQRWVVERLVDVVNRSMAAKPVVKFDRAKKQEVPQTDENGNPVYQFDSIGATRALELLGRHLGMYWDKYQATVGVNVHADMSKEEAISIMGRLVKGYSQGQLEGPPADQNTTDVEVINVESEKIEEKDDGSTGNDGSANPS